MPFFGQSGLLNRIVRGALGTSPVGFAVIGARLLGKTALLNALAAPDGPLLAPTKAGSGRLQVDPLWVDCALAGAYERLQSQVRQRLEGELQTGSGDNVIHRLARDTDLASAIQRMADAGRRPLLLLDNFDALEDRQPFVQLLATTAPCAAAILTARQPFHDLEMEDVAAISSLRQQFLGLLDPDAAQEWLTWSATEQGLDLGDWLPCLAALTGGHPFLLSCVSAVLAELQSLLTGGMDEGTLSLLRLRLAEHGRPLFGVMEQALQSPPPFVNRAALDGIVRRLLGEPVPLQSLSGAELPALNWLLNQAIATFDGRPCRLFSPLLGEYLGATSHLPPAVRPRDATPAGLEGVYAGLTKTEEALLRYLVERRDSVVSSQQLLSDVWRQPDATHRRVQEAVRRLRLQLDKVDPPIGTIRNERGRGYRFVPA